MVTASPWCKCSLTIGAHLSHLSRPAGRVFDWYSLGMTRRILNASWTSMVVTRGCESKCRIDVAAPPYPFVTSPTLKGKLTRGKPKNGARYPLIHLPGILDAEAERGCKKSTEIESSWIQRVWAGIATRFSTPGTTN